MEERKRNIPFRIAIEDLHTGECIGEWLDIANVWKSVAASRRAAEEYVHMYDTAFENPHLPVYGSARNFFGLDWAGAAFRNPFLEDKYGRNVRQSCDIDTQTASDASGRPKRKRDEMEDADAREVKRARIDGVVSLALVGGPDDT